MDIKIGRKRGMELVQQPARLHRPKVQPEQVLGWIALVLLGLNMGGCNILPKADLPEVEAQSAPPESSVKGPREIEYEKLLAEKEAQQHEIERLQKLLAEKEAHIRSQEVRQQDQAKALQETSSQAAHAKVRLRRLATRPAAASTIAEVEMIMENLKSFSMTDSEKILQTQAQLLLNAATASYAEDNYATAMDYAAQAREFIDMVRNNRALKATDAHQVTVPFQVPIPLRAKVNSNLRQQPSLRAGVLGMLGKDSTMTAEAYRGDWLQIVTADGRSGWVFNILVEAQLAAPRRSGQLLRASE
jgi:uncharacterized protein YgiM (DUF1202 family)